MIDKLKQRNIDLICKYKLKLKLEEYLPDFGGSVSLKYGKKNFWVMVNKSRDGVVHDIGYGTLEKCEWYSIDVLWNYLHGNIDYMKAKSINESVFIRENFNWLNEIFSPSKYHKTKKILHSLELKRSKKLFGK